MATKLESRELRLVEAALGQCQDLRSNLATLQEEYKLPIIGSRGLRTIAVSLASRADTLRQKKSAPKG